jgi:hypothetical protein
MDYILDFRLAKWIEEGPADSKGPQRIFASYGFSEDAPPPPEEMLREFCMQAIQVAKGEYPTLYCDVNRIEFSPGSIHIVIILNAVALVPGPGAAIAAGSLALWVAGKLFGGILGEFGKRVASFVWEKTAEFGRRVFATRKPDNLCDPLAIADQAVAKLAAERGVIYTMFSGPYSVQQTVQCTFEFLPLTGSVRPEHKYVTIAVDSLCKSQPVVRVHN